eukprot:scaffold147501_cov35-Attheya_sp.AAC.1
MNELNGEPNAREWNESTDRVDRAFSGTETLYQSTYDIAYVAYVHFVLILLYYSTGSHVSR